MLACMCVLILPTAVKACHADLRGPYYGTDVGWVCSCLLLTILTEQFLLSCRCPEPC